MIQIDEIPAKEIIPGFVGKFLHGSQSTLGIWNIKVGSSMPEHQHFHEQLTYVQEGELEMVIAGEKMHFSAGNLHVIPPNTPHSALAITDCRVIDFFAPAREEYR